MVILDNDRRVLMTTNYLDEWILDKNLSKPKLMKKIFKIKFLSKFQVNNY